MRIRALIAGVRTYLPGFNWQQKMRESMGGTDSARYCFTVWLRHLKLAHDSGLCASVPARVAELGPGNSIGTGLAALLSGAQSYTGLDLMAYTDLRSNLRIFDELVELFRQRAPLPGPDEFPAVKPHLSSYDFPEDLVPQLDGRRVDLIRRSIETPSSPESVIRYAAPWDRGASVDQGCIDMIFSQAVLEHVDDLVTAYAAMASWLAPNGFVSHQIDFKSHGVTREWNGHWAQSDFAWSLVRGRQPCLINREPHSTHKRLLLESGFQVMCDRPHHSPSQLERRKLAKQFAHLSDLDLTTSGAFIQARLGRGARA